MSTPQHITMNQKALLMRIDNEDIDERQKMSYREDLERAVASTNGRTVDEKIQDLTEMCTRMMQYSIIRDLDDKKVYQKIDSICDSVNKITDKIKNNEGAVIDLIEGHKEGGKYSIKKRGVVEIIVDGVVSTKWAIVALGTMICVSLIFRPELSALLKALIEK